MQHIPGRYQLCQRSQLHPQLTNPSWEVVTAATGMDQLQLQPHIRHHTYHLMDVKSENMAKHFDQFYQLADEQLKENNMLVHCFAGVSRSATLVISYLMKKHNWSFKDAIAEVRKYRPQVLPNLGFELQLKAYEKQLKGPNTTSNRKYVSKTSQSRKHHQIKNNSIGLPEIFALGVTMGRKKTPLEPIASHPSSQMENRKTKKPQQFSHYQQIPQNQFVAMERPTKGYNFSPHRKIPARSFRKRSVSINRQSRKEGAGILLQLQKDLVQRNQVNINPQKHILRQIKVATDRNVRGIGL